MKRWLLIAIAAFATAGFGALGVWQVERRAWKLALIERVEQRVHAAPVAAPGPREWAEITRENAEYRRVMVTGRFLRGRQTLVRAVTDLGEGFWVMAPLRTEGGFTVLVNRGFVLREWRDSAATRSPQSPGGSDAGASSAASDDAFTAASDAASTAASDNAFSAASSTTPGRGSDDASTAASSTVTVTGLLRLSEPNGAFLRSNAPAENRWYSRDVDALSHAQHLTGTAPYFIDAEAGTRTGPPESDRSPVAGLTVVHFRNSHLQYAITWFTLALMALGLGVRIARTR